MNRPDLRQACDVPAGHAHLSSFGRSLFMSTLRSRQQVRQEVFVIISTTKSDGGSSPRKSDFYVCPCVCPRRVGQILIPASVVTDACDMRPVRSPRAMVTHALASNVQMGQVQDVQLADLCGVDDVITALEDHIIMPLENLQLAAELGLTPKRGVMLAGPPGTGKTTIGRALARRLRGKFFLIDGTVISGTEYFYHKINSIFHMAIENAPSIVFIDDSDVIFESGREHGLYRYLLTMLDGLESKSASDVCVIMTAMDLGNIPPALVRSGRIELWLEMRLPDDVSRRRLLEQLFADKVRVDAEEFWPEILGATDGFSGADLKRLVQDAKLQTAVDITRNRNREAFHHYLLRAASVISDSRLAYATAAARGMEANADRPRWFNIHPELFDKRK